MIGRAVGWTQTGTVTDTRGHHLWGRLHRINMVFTTWAATCGNGATKGIVTSISIMYYAELLGTRKIPLLG